MIWFLYFIHLPVTEKQINLKATLNKKWFWIVDCLQIFHYKYICMMYAYIWKKYGHIYALKVFINIILLRFGFSKRFALMEVAITLNMRLKMKILFFVLLLLLGETIYQKMYIRLALPFCHFFLPSMPNFSRIFAMSVFLLNSL